MKFNYVTYIRTTPEKLWAALTTNHIIRKYWFGMSTESDWKVGSKWTMHSEDEIMDSGEILEILSCKRLVRSWRNEWKPELKAEGYTHCVYEIEEFGTAVRFTVTHSIEREQSEFIAAVSVGWPMILSNLKSLLETGEVALTEHPGHPESDGKTRD